MTEKHAESSLQLALVVALDRPPGNAGPAARLMAAALERHAWAGKVAVVGADAGMVAEALGTGWSLLINSEWHQSGVPGLRRAMQALPLMDGFFLAAADETPVLPLGASAGEGGTLRAAMCEAYATGRRKLMRIVVPTVGGEPVWPWLVDIGFRQPFVELPVNGSPRDVVEANRGQVVFIDAAPWAQAGTKGKA